MEDSDRAKIIELSGRNFLLNKLYNEHKELEEKLARFEKRPFLTASEQQEQKLLKRKKLLGVDNMMRILHQNHHVNGNGAKHHQTNGAAEVIRAT
jgi:uncharacterized protein YdcH (DUF465 family)